MRRRGLRRRLLPQGGLLDHGRRLYGVTYEGGVQNGGIVFSMSKKTGQTKVLYSFGSASGGSIQANGSLVDVDGLAFWDDGPGRKVRRGDCLRRQHERHRDSVTQL